jgi:hypothetical protein
MMSGQSYREFLQVRNGRGISEAEAKRLLEQVLPTLTVLHQQGQSHGNISLDTVLRQGAESSLSSGVGESFSRPIDDIYQVGNHGAQLPFLTLFLLILQSPFRFPTISKILCQILKVGNHTTEIF